VKFKALYALASMAAFGMGAVFVLWLQAIMPPDPPSCRILKDQYGQPYNYAVIASGTEKRPMTRRKCEDEWEGVFNEGG